MTRGITIALILAAGLALAGFRAPAALAAAEVVSPTGPTLTIDVGKGVIVRLDHPAASVFISDPGTADVQLKSPTVLYVVGKSAGETTIYAVDAKDNVLLDSRVDVRQDIDRLQREIDQLAPHSGITARGVDDSIVLSGTLTSAATGDDIRKLAGRYVASPAQLVNKMNLDEPNQINLQVRVAEVDRSTLKQFGINWQTITQNGFASFGIVSAVPTLTSLSTSSSKVIPLIAGESAPATIQQGSNIIGFNTQDSTLIGNAVNNNFFAGIKEGHSTINALVDALSQQGLITVLAEPNLTTVSGQKASFLAGGEFPVPVPQTGGGNSAAITIDWKEFGVSLNFTPTILANGRIGLHVAPEVSQLAPQQGITLDGVTVPGITTRKADTTVELGSGQSFAIAGLLQNSTQQQLQAYPWIGDIPIIGALFRSTAFQRGESELVIIVTPYVVQPASSATAMKLPTDGFEAPTDSDRVAGGKMNHVPGPSDAPAADHSAAAAKTDDADVPQAAPRDPVAGPVTLPAPTAAQATAPTAATTLAAAPAQPAPVAQAAPQSAAPQTAAAPAPKHSTAGVSGFEID
jgi:pilus assembly protein CpaC